MPTAPGPREELVTEREAIEPIGELARGARVEQEVVAALGAEELEEIVAELVLI